MLSLEASLARWPLRTPFAIARGTIPDVRTVHVRLVDRAGHMGVAEAVGVDHHGETAESVLADIEAMREAIRGGLTREALDGLLPAGGARNALDCALWDLEAKRYGIPAWRAAGLDRFAPCETAYTFGLMAEDALRDAVQQRREFSLLKVKTDRDRGMDPVRIVHEAAPYARLIVDPNEAWTEADLKSFCPAMEACGVALLEQPVHHEQDELLRTLSLPIPIAADEAFTDAHSIKDLVGKYQVLNIKLDKTGGLTEALRCVAVGRNLGFTLMAGCMAGSSLAIAPAIVIAQHCHFVDLDGPLLQAADCQHAIIFTSGTIGVPSPALWG